MPNIVGITTCKGRLEHIKQSSKAFLESTPRDVRYLIVDYSCPDNSGDWVIQNFGHTGRVGVLKMRAKPDSFHKTIALNAGSKYAIHTMGAEWLIYFDADTIIMPGFLSQVLPLLNKDRFIIAEPTGEEDLTGLLIMHKDMFTASGGFEPSFKSWGAEDLEFRLRLFAKHGFQFDIVGCDNLVPIHHGDDLRVKFYYDKDIDFSNKRNFYRLREMYHMYTGRDLLLHKLDDHPDKDALFKLLSLHPRIKK